MNFAAHSKRLAACLFRAILVIFACMALCAQGWAQDESAPEDLVLIVKSEGMVLSNGILAFQYRGSYYIPVSELSRLIEFYAESEPERGYVHGWYQEEKNSFSIDTIRREMTGADGRRIEIPAEAVLPEDFAPADEVYLRQEELSDIWPVTFRVDLPTLSLDVSSEQDLPFKTRMARELRRQKLLDRQELSTARENPLPFVPNKYKSFSLPVLNLESTAEYRGRTDEVTSRTNINGVNDFLFATADYSISVDYDNQHLYKPDNIRFRLSRSSIQGDPLPLGLKNVEGGDVRLQYRDLVGNGVSGRGVLLSNDPENRSGAFNTTDVEGIGTPGWEVELYRNNELIDFALVDERGEYRFEDVQLSYGNNQLRTILYGPQGQVLENVEDRVFSQAMVQAGKVVFSAGGVQKDVDLIRLQPYNGERPDGVAVSGSISGGLSDDVTAFANVMSQPGRPGERSRRYYSAGAIVSALGGYAQAEGYRDEDGGVAMDFRYATSFMGVNVDLRSAHFNNFYSQEAGFGSSAKEWQGELGLNKVVQTWFGALGLRLDVKQREFKTGAPITDIDTRQSFSVKGIRFTNQTTTTLNDFLHQNSSGRITASARVRRWHMRSSFDYNIYPEWQISALDSELRFRPSRDFSVAWTVDKNFSAKSFETGLQVSQDFDSFLGSLSGTWNADGGITVTARASTSLGPYGRQGEYIMSSTNLTQQSPLTARIFLDKDYDGAFTESVDEPIEEARISVDGRKSREESDDEGIVRVLERPRSEAVNIVVDKSTLPDPYYAPESPGYSLVPRLGSMTGITLPIIETGYIDGTVIRDSNGAPVPGMKIQLVDAEGKVVNTVETAYDGYYTFEFVAPGQYLVKADPSYGIEMESLHVQVSGDSLFSDGNDLVYVDAGGSGEGQGAENAGAEGKKGVFGPYLQKVEPPEPPVSLDPLPAPPVESEAVPE